LRNRLDSSADKPAFNLACTVADKVTVLLLYLGGHLVVGSRSFLGSSNSVYFLLEPVVYGLLLEASLLDIV